MISGADYCVSCGRIIPEGSHVCNICRSEYIQPINIAIIKREKRKCSLIREIKERIFRK